MDPHALLGLTPGAGERQIKHAFRRLAMRWHPDRNPDPAALEHFKRLRAAHDALLAGCTDTADDPDDDAAADRPSSASQDGADQPDSRGADRREELTLTLDEAFCGCDKTVELARETLCELCGGRGEETLSHSRLCAECHGSGRLRSTDGLVSCSHCNGKGYRRTHTCTPCGGSGRARRARNVSVKIPPGLLSGDELRLAGEGEPPVEAGGRPGDLRLRITLAPHALFELDGRDLILERPVSALRMLIGGELRIPLPGGAVCKVPLEPGSAQPRQLEIAGAGFPGRGNQAGGTLIVRLRPVLPGAADADLQERIRALETALAADLPRHLPEVARWEMDWLSDAASAPE